MIVSCFYENRNSRNIWYVAARSWMNGLALVWLWRRRRRIQHSQTPHSTHSRQHEKQYPFRIFEIQTWKRRRRKKKNIHKKLGISVYVTIEFHSKYSRQRRTKLHINASDRPNYLHSDTHSLTHPKYCVDLRTWTSNTYWIRTKRRKKNEKRKTAIHRNTNNTYCREVIPSLSRPHNRDRKRRWSNERKMHLPSQQTRNQTNGEKNNVEKWIVKEKNNNYWCLWFNAELSRRTAAALLLQYYQYNEYYISSISFYSLLFSFFNEQWTNERTNTRDLGVS